TYGSVPNTLVIANCDVVKLKVAAAEHISQFSEEASSPFVKKFKTILHRGETRVAKLNVLEPTTGVARDTCDAVTIIDTLPMVFVGVVAYVNTPCGLRSLYTV
ncbi:WD40 repeat-containing protein MSI4, partial [Tanacetum coccineum]